MNTRIFFLHMQIDMSFLLDKKKKDKDKEVRFLQGEKSFYQ